MAQLNQASDDPQWALELADHLIRLGGHADEARRRKIEALSQLADQTLNAPTRNYYLTVAKEMREALSK